MDDGHCLHWRAVLVLAYHVIAYRVFSGRLAEEDVASMNGMANKKVLPKTQECC